MRNQLINFITSLGLTLAALSGGGAFAQAPKSPLSLKPDAPDRYIVVPGDTLWGIAERFTDSPWRWSELWELNKSQIKNPNRIYPGDVILLDRARGQLALADTVKLSPRVRADSTARQAIPSIPQAIIEPFLSRPLVIEPEGLDKAPTIVATEGSRVILGPGDRAFVRGIGNSKENSWYVYRRGNALVDPDSNTTLGYEAIYLGNAQLERAGDPAVVTLATVTQEVSRGDKLIPAGRPQAIDYAPHAPSTQVRGRVMSIYGSVGRVGEAGPQSVITINRGRADGIEIGHVLALYRPGVDVSYVASRDNATTEQAKIPGERNGLAIVFRVFDRISYALVMRIAKPVSPLDAVQNP